MRYLAFTVSIVIVFGIWVAGISGIFQLPEALLYDYCVRLTPEVRTTASHILLIEADHRHKTDGDDTWLSLLDFLETMHPRQILFTFLPKHTSEDFYRAAEGYSNVLFGRETLNDSSRADGLVLESLPEAFESQKLQFGLVTIPQSYHGMHRYQYTGILIDEQKYPSLDYIAAHTFQQMPSLSDNIPYRVNFNGKFHGMPTITIERVFSQDIVADLVREKYVIIGFRKSHLDSGLHTPITPAVGMSLLEFHGHALDTLLSEKFITEPGYGMTLLLISIVVVIGLVLYQLLDLRFFAWCVFLVAGGYLLITWGVFSYFLLWLPIAEILTAHLCIFLFIFFRRTIQQEQSTYRILTQTSVKLRERVIPESFYDSEEHWTQIINMVNQTLDLNRVIFLEAVRDNDYVREIRALNCSLSDINERRRDYRRAPYSTAIEQNRFVKLEEFVFLTKAQAEEEQYLVPLIFGGRVLGFWAFGIEASKVPGIANFDSVIMGFGNQISELLYRREHKHLQKFSGRSGIWKYLTLQESSTALRELNHSIVLLERRLSLLETVLDGISTAVILYDLFGQVLHVNKHMSELMKNAAVLPYKMTATDFASTVGRLPIDDVRHLLRELLFEHKPITLPAFLASEEHKQYMLSIRSLLHDEHDTFIEDASPFQVYGILFELLEVTELRMFNQLKDELFDNINYQLRRDFEPVMLAYSLLEGQNLSEKNSRKVFKILYQRIENMLAFIKHVGLDLLKDTFTQNVNYYPINPKQPLVSAVSAFKEQTSLRRLTFDVEMPESVGLVCAGPEGLVAVIKALLSLLITDAVENSQIRIDLIETDMGIIYNFSNTGFGMPNSVFQQYLLEDADVASPEFKKLRTVISQVQEWGGKAKGLK